MTDSHMYVYSSLIIRYNLFQKIRKTCRIPRENEKTMYYTLQFLPYLFSIVFVIWLQSNSTETCYDWIKTLTYQTRAHGGTAGWGRKFAGSIPESVIGIFHWHNTSGRTMALGSTEPLKEMSTRNISWGVKAAGA
jgi:hypothetical protein